MTSGRRCWSWSRASAAGTINTVVGSGTLITFPVLLSVGHRPGDRERVQQRRAVPGFAARARTATAANSPGSAGASLSAGRRVGARRARRGGAAASAAVGGVHAIVPVLIVLALVLVVFGPQITDRLAHAAPPPAPFGHGAGSGCSVLLHRRVRRVLRRRPGRAADGLLRAVRSPTTCSGRTA